MSSARNRSIATNCWRKNSMMSANSGTSRMEPASVVVHQILDEDGSMWSTLRWSQNDLSPVGFFQIYWERFTNPFCIDRTLLASFDRWNLSAHPCPSGYRLLQLDQYSRNMGSFKKRSWITSNVFLMHLFLKLWAIWWPLCSWVFPNRWPWGPSLLMT